MRSVSSCHGHSPLVFAVLEAWRHCRRHQAPVGCGDTAEVCMSFKALTRGCLPAFASSSFYWPMLPFVDQAGPKIFLSFFRGALVGLQLLLLWCELLCSHAPRAAGLKAPATETVAKEAAEVAHLVALSGGGHKQQPDCLGFGYPRGASEAVNTDLGRPCAEKQASCTLRVKKWLKWQFPNRRCLLSCGSWQKMVPRSSRTCESATGAMLSFRMV